MHNKGLAMFSRFARAAWAAAALPICTASLADYHVDILPPVTPVSSDIYHLHWSILWVCVVIFFIVFLAGDFLAADFFDFLDFLAAIDESSNLLSGS